MGGAMLPRDGRFKSRCTFQIARLVGVLGVQ